MLATPFKVSRVLAELADDDFLQLDPAGRITAAYPFSAVPTQHRVQLSGGASVFAMCAIDALGMSAMTGLPAVIESADPSTGRLVTVNVEQTDSIWDPATAVVYVGRTGACAGPSASVCCDYINFFTTRAAASAWAADHPEITGGILNQTQALQIGITIFGKLLS
ncbi:MAG TPA: alkylmercury lyase family protein [Streptosporangiaceae bacterium]